MAAGVYTLNQGMDAGEGPGMLYVEMLAGILTLNQGINIDKEPGVHHIETKVGIDRPRNPSRRDPGSRSAPSGRLGRKSKGYSKGQTQT
jgi:hypothetical protein